MSIWFVFALMSAAAAFAVLWPLGRKSAALPPDAGLGIYKEQLAEIDRDLAGGVIAKEEADAARIEVSRRLLASQDREMGGAQVAPSGQFARRGVALIALIVLPAAAIIFYARIGEPNLLGQPLAMRNLAPVASGSLGELVAKVEAHLEKNPGDGKGWEVLAPVLMRLGRFDDAVRAYRNVIDTLGESASRRADLGEAISASANGVITAQAKTEFERAVALNITEPKAQYFLGIAARQDGRPNDAIAIWDKMIADAPPNAPWLMSVRKALADLRGVPLPPQNDAARGPNAADIEAAAAMPDKDRNEMIRGMVAQLADRLAKNPDDVDGWLRLIRSYMVLGEQSSAQAALAKARQALGGNAEQLTKLNEGAAKFGF